MKLVIYTPRDGVFKGALIANRLATSSMLKLSGCKN